MKIEKGHLYMRGADFKGYGDKPIVDHGRLRAASSEELVLVHGHTKEEKSNVVVALDGAPAQSLNLPLKSTPEIRSCLGALKSERLHNCFTKRPRLRTFCFHRWVLVQPSGTDDTELLQAALNSGARYVGFLMKKISL